MSWASCCALLAVLSRVIWTAPPLISSGNAIEKSPFPFSVTLTAAFVGSSEPSPQPVATNATAPTAIAARAYIDLLIKCFSLRMKLQGLSRPPAERRGSLIQTLHVQPRDLVQAL